MFGDASATVAASPKKTKETLHLVEIEFTMDTVIVLQVCQWTVLRQACTA